MELKLKTHRLSVRRTTRNHRCTPERLTSESYLVWVECFRLETVSSVRLSKITHAFPSRDCFKHTLDMHKLSRLQTDSNMRLW